LVCSTYAPAPLLGRRDHVYARTSSRLGSTVADVQDRAEPGRWQRAPGALWRSLPDGLLLLLEGDPHPVMVAGAALAVWHALDRAASIEDLVQDVDGSDRVQVGAALEVLRQAGAVVPEPVR
jgi:hypothetical protein